MLQIIETNEVSNEKVTNIPTGLKTAFDPLASHIEIGIDETGRGPLFGRLYVAAVVLPKGFTHKDIKDSKKLSDKKIRQMSALIKETAIAWSVQYIEHDIIDEINIRQSVFRGMHAAIREIAADLAEKLPQQRDDLFLLVDGNDFKPYMAYNEEMSTYKAVPYETIEHGDATYLTIAAASILAKNARDRYIDDLCDLHPQLSDRYHLQKNKGYGTKQHLEGIQQHGITQWHRRSYARCDTAIMNPI
jgi:ribonuclease HII